VVSEVVAVGELVVGVDGSDGSRTALAWAVDEARLSGHDVVVVTVVGPREPESTDVVVPADAGRADQDMSRRAGALLEDVVAPYADAGVRITRVACHDGTTVQTLLQRSRDADALIVGSRGLGVMRRLLLGSVSSQVVVHGTTTIVVVPQPSDERQRSDKVVVAVDGSQQAVAALRRAAVEAARRDWELELVTVQPPPPATGGHGQDRAAIDVYRWWTGWLTGDQARSPEAQQQDYQQLAVHWRNVALGQLDEALAQVDDTTLPGKVKTTVIAADHAADALLDIAAWARLLVVGRRGRGGFTGMLLGSVSQHCVRHATSPIMVVPMPAM
jgi:nucleotide-binding universal stress UspA family protein